MSSDKTTTKSSAKTSEDGLTPMAKLERNFNHYKKQAAPLIDNTKNADIFFKWSIQDLLLRQERLKKCLEKLDDTVLEASGIPDAQSLCDGYETLSDEIMLTLAKISERAKQLGLKPDQPVTAAAPSDKIQIVEVQQLDSSGNIQNVWGDFDGDYSKWRTFYDKWLAHMHNNERVKPITKLQNLQAACTGDAKIALGEWEVIADNYDKAFNRLISIYEDEYMQVLSFMQKLYKIPQIKSSSSRTFREVIDTVHKYINGLNKYLEMDDSHPHAVFAVIAKMDTDTYRAWERHRPLLAKAEAERNGERANAAIRPGKYIPKWSELESFLEGEINVRMHAERRECIEETAPQYDESPTKNFADQKESKDRMLPEHLQCVLCDYVHPIYRCDSFMAMDLIDRANHVNEYDLCMRCLRKNHSDKCVVNSCNKECPKCRPEIKFHNNSLCPNAYSKAEQAFKLDSDQRKRSNQGKQNNAKHKRYDEQGYSYSNPNEAGSGVHKPSE